MIEARLHIVPRHFNMARIDAHAQAAGRKLAHHLKRADEAFPSGKVRLDVGHGLTFAPQ